MKKSQIAIENFKSLNCAQSVLLTYAEDVNLDHKTALSIARGFGGGMTMGETCGAVTGAYMVLGLFTDRMTTIEKHNPDFELQRSTENSHLISKTNEQIKAESRAAVRKFNELFIARHGSLQCKKLLGVDLSEADGSQKANELHLFDTVCVGLVASAAEIVQENF